MRLPPSIKYDPIMKKNSDIDKRGYLCKNLLKYMYELTIIYESKYFNTKNKKIFNSYKKLFCKKGRSIFGKIRISVYNAVF